MTTEIWERYNGDKNAVEETAEIEIPAEGRYSREFRDLVLEWLLPLKDDPEDLGCWSEGYFAYPRDGNTILIQPAENRGGA